LKGYTFVVLVETLDHTGFMKVELSGVPMVEDL